LAIASNASALIAMRIIRSGQGLRWRRPGRDGPELLATTLRSSQRRARQHFVAFFFVDLASGSSERINERKISVFVRCVAAA
jgi:hypothetical protein